MSDEQDRDEAETAGDETSEPGEGADATGATPSERQAKDELFEAIDHFKNAASILFERASKDPAVKSATTEAERLAKKLGTAAEPLARQLTDEVGRLTRDVWSVVEGKGKRPAPPPPPPRGEAEATSSDESDDE